ncbi:MAG: hypothetical protein AB1635_11665 [Acidobacteriota bacterium]
MAKKKAKKKAPKKTTKKIDLCKPVKAASAIVAQVVAHFGAGYAAQRFSENTAGPLPNFQIFCAPSDMAQFYNRLLKSTRKHFAAIKWHIDQPNRDAVCATAFKHGVLARKEVSATGATCLTWTIILKTLRDVQATDCPVTGGAGGGRVCDF